MKGAIQIKFYYYYYYYINSANQICTLVTTSSSHHYQLCVRVRVCVCVHMCSHVINSVLRLPVLEIRASINKHVSQPASQAANQPASQAANQPASQPVRLPDRRGLIWTAPTAGFVLLTAG